MFSVTLKSMAPEDLVEPHGLTITHHGAEPFGPQQITVSSGSFDTLASFVFNNWVGEGSDVLWFAWVMHTLVRKEG